MKKKILTSLGLMSGTSMDGVDLSLIKSDGYNHIEHIFDKYYEFSEDLYKELINLRDEINTIQDLKDKSHKINEIEKKFTLFNCKIVNDLIKNIGLKPDLIGFHGQTIFHKVKDKISIQIGDGHLLSQMTRCPVINKFRQKDLDNDGQGAPLTPIFHSLLSAKIHKKFNLKFPISVINIGGITNISSIVKHEKFDEDIFAFDIGPGNCMIDEWIRKNSDRKFDHDGKIANSGIINELILNQAIDNFSFNSIRESLDIKSFDISFVKGLSFEDGCATLNKFTAFLIAEGLKKIDQINNLKTKNFLLCGGGRKNITLIRNLIEYMNNKEFCIKNIDEYDINGDFIESQAFGYLAIRSFLNLPISFPNTTRCIKPCSGGELIENF